MKKIRHESSILFHWQHSGLLIDVSFLYTSLYKTKLPHVPVVYRRTWCLCGLSPLTYYVEAKQVLWTHTVEAQNSNLTTMKPTSLFWQTSPGNCFQWLLLEHHLCVYTTDYTDLYQSMSKVLQCNNVKVCVIIIKATAYPTAVGVCGTLSLSPSLFA